MFWAYYCRMAVGDKQKTHRQLGGGFDKFVGTLNTPPPRRSAARFPAAG
jgi:hypothetical protein